MRVDLASPDRALIHDRLIDQRIDDGFDAVVLVEQSIAVVFELVPRRERPVPVNGRKRSGQVLGRMEEVEDLTRLSPSCGLSPPRRLLLS